MDLRQTLAQYVSDIEANGIMQHSDSWLTAKRYTIGGSNIATIMGQNYMSSVSSIIRERVGLASRGSNEKMQWGNLFEDVIKIYVEMTHDCEVLGENMYITTDNKHISYSPDGLAVMRGPGGEEEIVLLEFKCPYSRIPGLKPPAYYVPQVKMGLDVIPLATRGLFVEAVFRRCSWADFVPTAAYNPDPVKTTRGAPRAMGCIGFSASSGGGLSARFLMAYLAAYEALGDEGNGWATNDLGSAPGDLFIELLEQYNAGAIMPKYYDILPISLDRPPVDHDDFPALHSAHCAETGQINIGILPWKLFHVGEHWIDPTPDFLAPWEARIGEIMTFIESCNGKSKKDIARAYSEFIAPPTQADDYEGL